MPGLYKRFGRNRGFQGRGAMFFDRDGVLIEDSGYLCDPAHMRWIPGAPEAIARLNRSGVPVIVVTNQSGIARGYYGWKEFEQVQSALEAGLAEHGGWLDGVLACGFHEDGQGEYQVEDHPWRKPNPGMILEGLQEFGLDRERSWLTGDRPSDLEAGLRAELGRVLLVETGLGVKSRAAFEQLRAAQGEKMVAVQDAAEAADRYLREAVTR